MSIKGCKHSWNDIFLTQYSQDTEENAQRRADDAVNDSASKTHFVVFSKAICSFWHQQAKTVPLYSGLNSQGRNEPYEFTLAWEECCYFHNAKEMYLNILAYRTGWIRHEGMPTICKAPLKMMSHWGESKHTSYVREQSTSPLQLCYTPILQLLSTWEQVPSH